MNKITQVLFSDTGKITTQYAGVPHQQLKPHEVWIAPAFYGAYGSDLCILKGDHPFIKPPVVPGHEIAACVMRIDSDVKNVQPGDHVMIGPIMTCMECRACRAGRFSLCEPPQVVGFRAPGFARSRHIVSAHSCHVASASLSLKALAFAEPAACARHYANRMPETSLESVLVVGAGATGLSIVQVLCIIGVGKITVIEPDTAEHALALKLGTAEVWAPGELAADVQFMGAIDIVTVQATLNDACTRVYAGGTVVCMGVPSGPCEIPLPVMQRFERDLLSSGMHIPEDFNAAIEQLADRRFDASELVTDLSAIRDAAATFERVQQNDPMKVMLQFAPERLSKSLSGAALYQCHPVTIKKDTVMSQITSSVTRSISRPQDVIDIVNKNSAINTNIGVIFIALGDILIGAYQTAMVGFGNKYIAAQFGTSPSLAATVNASVLTATLIGGLLADRAVNRFGQKRAFIIGMGLCTIGTAAVTIVPSVWRVLVYCVITGFSLGIDFPLAANVVAELRGSTSKKTGTLVNLW